ncbi:uncharacterized protein LOC129408877 [Boleophthalmus pectinirostris]|uniref:uncharacterized protein LOC129408877 n=1 Tax=Boleophthalmus pectinirostris TaxID=150288 RepID=UPI0024316D17|nr:uncharacterized protein LOC129408877 [Boleophthalmus pectinirostris]
MRRVDRTGPASRRSPLYPSRSPHPPPSQPPHHPKCLMGAAGVRRADKGKMLLKVKIANVQKFVRVPEPNLTAFLDAAFTKFGVPAVTEGVRVLDSSGTELDEDVFEDVVKDPQTGVLTITYDTGNVESFSSPGPCASSPSSGDSQDTIILPVSPASKRQRLDDEAKHLVKDILSKKPGGERVIMEYNRTKSLADDTRKKMVNILAADMTEKNGTSPPRRVKEKYARGIVSLFPHLWDPFSENGHEHYYDGKSDSGYLAWRLKYIQRCNAQERKSIEASSTEGMSGDELLGGPTARRESQYLPEPPMSEEECREAMSLMKHSSDENTLSSNILSHFPRFKDVKGLIEQDFVLMFGEDVSGKFLEKWPTMFKEKIIKQCRKLPSTTELNDLLLAADPQEDDADGADFGWDSDFASILLLLHLVPPTAQGRKKPGKMSASQAEKHLVVFKKSGTSIEEHLDTITSSTQPYLLAVGTQRNRISQYFIILDKTAIPCMSNSSLSSFDELFKAHFVFGTSYHTMLYNMYTFIQTTIYNIDVGKVRERPRIAEIRARLLH